MNKKEMMKQDLVILLIWPVIAALLSLIFKFNLFITMILFLGVPPAYLSWRNKKLIKRIALFSLVFSVPITLTINYIMELTGGWHAPDSIFGSFLLLGSTIDMYLWGFLYFYFVSFFYEHFLEKHKQNKLYYPYLKYGFILLLVMSGIFLIIYFTNPALLRFDYFYLKAGLVFGVLPVAGVLLKFPKLYGKFLKTASYFFFVSFIYEMTALALGHWSFPAENQFIGMVDLFGLKFPFEELFFWMMLGAMAVLSYFEFFDDDRK